MNNEQAALVEALTKKFNDDGRLIEAGWQSFRVIVVPPTAPTVQVTEMRRAFFAGAQHLFGSIMTVISDDDGEPTPQDLQRMDLIHQELEAYADELRREVAGRAR